MGLLLVGVGEDVPAGMSRSTDAPCSGSGSDVREIIVRGVPLERLFEVHEAVLS